MTYMSDDDVREALRKFIGRKWGDQGRAATKMGVSHEFLSLVLSGKRRPSNKVAEALGLECVRMWKVKGKSEDNGRETDRDQSDDAPEGHFGAGHKP